VGFRGSIKPDAQVTGGLASPARHGPAPQAHRRVRCWCGSGGQLAAADLLEPTSRPLAPHKEKNMHPTKRVKAI